MYIHFGCLVISIKVQGSSLRPRLIGRLEMSESDGPKSVLYCGGENCLFIIEYDKSASSLHSPN